MKNLIEETFNNLLIIKEKICYKDSEGFGCYKCPFGEDTDSGFECSLKYVLRDLRVYNSWFDNKEATK